MIQEVACRFFPPPDCGKMEGSIAISWRSVRDVRAVHHEHVQNVDILDMDRGRRNSSALFKI